MSSTLEIDILTLFPNMFQGPFEESIIRRARERGAVRIRIINFRDFATDRHKTVDDYPYGGGPGMVLKPEPLFAAVESVRRPESAVVLMTPQGRPFTQEVARELATFRHLVLVCGHYEGFDERVREALVTDELSIGDYVLTGGELPAMVIVDAVVRLLPGVIADPSIEDESFYRGLLEYPQYTRPALFRSMAVPEVLLSGDHGAIARWRRQQSLLRTYLRRPDLLRPEHWDELLRLGLL